MTLITFIIVLMIITAVFAVESRNMVASVIAVGTVGLGMSLTFLLLHAPDLAGVLLIVEVITLTILLRVVAALRHPPIRSYGRGTEAAAILFILFFAGIAFMAYRAMPAPFVRHDALITPLLAGGMLNRVTAIALGARPLEAAAGMAILVIAAVGAGALMRRSPRRKQ